MSAADYIEETTTSIAGTNGNGAVTLTQITGLPRFSHAFGTGTRMVEYVIEDRIALKFEKGLGTVTSNVLTRVTPNVTWDGTTWDDTAPAPYAFGSTPTTGNVRIRMAPTSDAAVRAPHAIYAGTSGGNSLTSGGLAYFPSFHIPIAPLQTGMTVGTTLEYYFCFHNIVRGRCAGMGTSIQTGGAGGAALKMGIYELGSDGLPGPCITRSASITATGTGVVVDATPGSWSVNTGPLRLNVGWYYIGLIGNDAAIVLHKNAQLAASINYTPLQGPNGYGFTAALSKTMENSFATGLPSGTPTGTYTWYNGNQAQSQTAALLALHNA